MYTASTSKLVIKIYCLENLNSLASLNALWVSTERPFEKANPKLCTLKGNWSQHTEMKTRVSVVSLGYRTTLRQSAWLYLNRILKILGNPLIPTDNRSRILSSQRENSSEYTSSVSVTILKVLEANKTCQSAECQFCRFKLFLLEGDGSHRLGTADWQHPCYYAGSL